MATVVPLALDPREFRERENEVGFGIASCLLVECGERGGWILSINSLERVPLKSLDGPLARAVESTQTLVIRERVITPTGSNSHIPRRGQRQKD